MANLLAVPQNVNASSNIAIAIIFLLPTFFLDLIHSLYCIFEIFSPNAYINTFSLCITLRINEDRERNKEKKATTQLIEEINHTERREKER